MELLAERRARLRRKRQRAAFLFLSAVLAVSCLLAVGLYNLPPVHERLAWRVDNVRARIHYWLNPPEDVVFAPQGGETSVAAAPVAMAATQTPAASPTATLGPVMHTATPTAPPTLTPTFTPTPTPLPPLVKLDGFVFTYQKYNNCGPATLAIALSYWGWQGTQAETAAVLKPNFRDKNVMPYEMADYVNVHTDLNALVRVGGDLALLKTLVSAGIPIIIERGFEGPSFDNWMGHYEVASGYDDAAGQVIVQDSFDGSNVRVDYEELEAVWRGFNFTYIVIYPDERAAEVQAILGVNWDETENFRTALARAEADIQALEGRDLFFARFNQGSSLTWLKDYSGAATAYDAAFAHYSQLEKDDRPWRMMWYQTGPYFAYFYSGRYQDVVDLSSVTLQVMSEISLEESFLWRARAKSALGDGVGAVADYRLSLKAHPYFIPALDDLELLGVEP